MNVPSIQDRIRPLGHDEPIAGSMRIRHRVLQAGGWALAGFAVEEGIALLQLVVLARLLVPGDFGLMMASAAILLAVQAFSELGLEPAVIAKPNVTEQDLRVAWTLSIIRGIVLAIGLWGLADVIATGITDGTGRWIVQLPRSAGRVVLHSSLLGRTAEIDLAASQGSQLFHSLIVRRVDIPPTFR